MTTTELRPVREQAQEALDKISVALEGVRPLVQIIASCRHTAACLYASIQMRAVSRTMGDDPPETPEEIGQALQLLETISDELLNCALTVEAGERRH